MRSVRRGGVLAALLAVPMLAALPVGPASALEGTVQSTTSPMWQTNGQVDALAYANGLLFAAGSFTSVRPPNVAAGTSEQARQYLAAFNSSTGVATSFSHTFDGAVKALATSPDGKRLYVGGSFKFVDGVARSRIAAFDTSTGALITAFAATADYTVNALGVGPTGIVYLGGGFGSVDKTARARLAAVTGDTGALVTGWNASADGLPYTISVSGGKVFVGGAFDNLDGAANRAIGTLDAATGALVPFPAQTAVPPLTNSCTSVVRDIVVTGGTAYVGAEGTGPGCFDGTFAANVTDGSLTWQNFCLGATQAVQVVGNYLYKGSHAHDCSRNTDDPDAFPQVPSSGGNFARHLLAENLANGRLGPWYPNTGGATGGLGPRAMATDGTQLFLGGDFLSLNNKGQQGLARFTAGADTTPPPAPAAPVAVPGAPGQVNVYVQAPVDQDDPDLTVRVYRDGATTPFASVPVHSLFWRQPVIGVSDTQTAGTKHTYRADVIETNDTGKSGLSGTASATSMSSSASYSGTVATDKPNLYWRLGEASGSVAADSSASLNAGSYVGTRTAGVAGALASDTDTAVTLDGATAVVGASTSVPSPSVYSAEAWFKTTTTNGGKIFGFGDTSTATSGGYDKHVYMLNDGRLTFGVYNGHADTVTSAKSYNDGAWHHVVATQGPAGMALFLDGAKVGGNPATTNQGYQGYWRVGGDNLNGWPNQPSSSSFAGTVDEFAVYGSALSPSRVAAHYAASGRTVAPSSAPTDAYGSRVYDDQPSLYWRVGEASGPTAVDASGNGSDGSYSSGITFGQAGAVKGTTSTAVATSGQDSSGSEGLITSPRVPTPGQFSVEAWFKTSTTSGGKIIGFGNAATGYSSSYDKHVYMGNDGRLTFGVYNGGFDLITSAGSYNDGAWHHVVATQGSSGMVLYVDGTTVGSNGATTSQGYDGYWRVGGDTLNGWPSQPSSAYLQGAVDEVAVYPVPLSAAQVSSHYTAGH